MLPLHLLRFEVRYQFARPVTWLYALLIFGQGIWYGLGAHTQFGSRLLWINSAANAYLVLASPGLILTVVACLLAGQSLTKDLEYKVADYAYATPIADRDYFLGKLLGTLLTVFVLALAYPLGTLAVPLFAGGITGPVPVGQLLDSFFMLLVQNLFIIVSIAFSASVFTRQMTGSYVVMFGMVLYFLISNLSVGADLPNDLLLLLDPFGVAMVRDGVMLMPIADKIWVIWNTRLCYSSTEFCGWACLSASLLKPNDISPLRRLGRLQEKTRRFSTHRKRRTADNGRYGVKHFPGVRFIRHPGFFCWPGTNFWGW